MEDKDDKRFKIYVSRVKADSTYAEELYQYLRNTLGQHNDLRIYGTRSGIQSVKAICTCKVFMILVSCSTFGGGALLNEQVNREYAEARNFNRNIICLFLEDKSSFHEGLIQKFVSVPHRIHLIFPEKAGGGINYQALLIILEKHGARLASADAADTGQEYDVFISCKSEDNKSAKTVCNFLQSRGLKVFFSKESLPILGSADFSEQIENAIEKSRNMVVVASKREYANAKWVKFEWRLFLNEKLAGRKDGNLLTVLAGGMTVNELPIALRNLEAIPLVPGEIEKLFEYVRPLIPQKDGGMEAKGLIPKALSEDASKTFDPAKTVRIGDFSVNTSELLKKVSWNDAYEYSRRLSATYEKKWNLPSIQQLRMIRKMSLFPDKYCYWSFEELGNGEVRYLHFDDGHAGSGKSFDNGLCAVFVRNINSER